jgi:hypothetical protein
VAKPALSPDEARADFAQLYTALQQAHYDLYARAPRRDYDALYAAVRAEITGPEPALEVAARFQRFVAFGKVAHARIDAAYDAFDHYVAGGGTVFPLRIRVVGDRVFIIENRSGLTAIERGDELVALGGQAIERWLVRTARNQSADTPYLAHALMERDFAMLLWLELGRVDRFVISARRAGGAAFDTTVPACSDAAMQAAARTQPPVLALDRKARIAHMVGAGVGYLRPGPFYNVDPGATSEYDNTAFRRFIDSAFERFLAAGAVALVIDLRDNPGGDSSFSDLMVGWFADRPFTFESSFRIRVSAQAIASNRKRVELAPDDAHSVSRRFAALYAEARLGDTVTFPVPAATPHPAPRFTGKVFVLVNRRSYSNTVAVAALVQDYGFATVTGEETADLATTYGAMETFTLRHSGLEVGFPKAYIVRPSGDLAPRGVVPDVVIATPVVESIDDPVLQQALALAANRPTAVSP